MKYKLISYERINSRGDYVLCVEVRSLINFLGKPNFVKFYGRDNSWHKLPGFKSVNSGLESVLKGFYEKIIDKKVTKAQ